MRFKLTSQSKKYLDTLDKYAVKRIYKALRDLTQSPPKGDIKQLKGMENIYRLRIGELRILYSIDGDNVIINKIASRGQVYK